MTASDIITTNKQSRNIGSRLLHENRGAAEIGQQSLDAAMRAHVLKQRTEQAQCREREQDDDERVATSSRVP